MSDMTRRRFIRNASMGVAAAGAIAATASVPELLGGGTSGPSAARPLAAPKTPAPIVGDTVHSTDGPVIAHVRDVSTGEISIFVGTEEIRYQDRQVAQALMNAVR